MNETPTSGPTSSSITHHARDASSSRHSFSSSQRNGPLGGRRKFLPRRRGFAGGLAARAAAGDSGARAFAADAPAAQQHEPIADAGGVGDLMNRQEDRPA